MVQYANTDQAARALSSAPSTAFSLLDSPDLGSSETKGGAADDASFSVDYIGYEGIDWNRLSGYSIRKHQRRPRTGWVWEHGFDIEKDGSGHRFWLCKMCHQKKATITHMYDAASTSQANGHMEDIHRINKDGSMPPQRKKQRTLFDMVDLDPHRPKDQALMNAFIASFEPARFQHLLIRWVACDNIPFYKLESPYFRDLMASILFGTDVDAFEEDCQADKEIQDEVQLWRSKGPVGKLHNIIHWVQRSGQRIEKLHKLQSIENTALSLEDKTTYDVITDNATRWNSSEAMMERGYLLRNALDSLVQAEVTEWNQYVARRTQNGIKPMPKKSRKKPAIVDDKMAAEDWSIIAEYLAILKPLKIATKRLEGRPQEGKFGAIWEVLLTMEWLLKHLEEAKLQHERDEEPYLRIGCNLGWMKLDQYYTLTEDSPAYLAALVLHPAFRWSTVESQWADHPGWLIRGKTAVQELWEEYRNLSVEQDALPEQPTIARKTTDLDDFMASIRKLSTQPAPSTSAMRDEYAEWVATTDPGDCLVDDPIQYWLLRRRQYPRLSRMAIDLFSVPAMSSEPERIFSLAGKMVTAQRGRLKADLIGAAQCISSWEKSGVIQISK
ncbi:transposase [Fusarium langsethiae]|uniref:Transposase n=1 Tax=Fusarium langsethiae TaxID=179993 RepID=A0A0N0DAI1_FUSLA|nr:transposase [Fusarium langsethiae]